MKRSMFFGAAVAAFAVASGAWAGGPGLIGDTVFADMQPDSIWAANPGSAIVADPGVEFSLDLVGTPFFEVDLAASSILLNYVATGGLGMGAGEVLTLTSLDFAGGETIIGINFSTSDTGVSGFDASDISFTADSVTIVLNGSSWQAGNTWALIELKTVPAPGAIALLGLAGFVGRRRRR